MQQPPSFFRMAWPAWAASVSCLLLVGQALVGAADLPAIVYPNYHNTLKLGTGNPAVTSASSAATFTGTMGNYSPPGSGITAVVPSGGTNRLVESAFGQTFAEHIPYPGFEEDAIRLAQASLYPAPNLTDRIAIAGSGTAFRYKDLQYERLPDGQVRLNYESVAGLFGTAERSQIQQAITTLREALKYAPFHRGLRNALLDVYYDWILAEQQIAKERRAETARIRLGLTAIDPNRLVIDYELANQTNVLNQYEAIWTTYSSLLYERAGVDLTRFVPSLPIRFPLGSYIFREEQPFRNQLAASFWDGGIKRTFDTNGAAIDGAPTVLFQGYKDYVALLSLLRDYVDTAAETARLYAMRGRTSPGVNDPQSAAALMSRVQTEAFIDLACLEGLLPGARTNATGASGLYSSWNGILTSMRELEGVAGFLRGDHNSLGFDLNMLVLFQSPQGTIEATDSYDALMQWINPDMTGTTVLGFARSRFDAAVTAYEQYRGYKDQLADQMSQIDDTYSVRYEEITGYSPGETPDPWTADLPDYPLVTPDVVPTHLNNPRPGSELQKAYAGISQVVQQMAKLDELETTIESQLKDVFQALEDANKYPDQVIEATESYKDKIREQRDIITHWRATQAASEGAYNIVKDSWDQFNNAVHFDPIGWIPLAFQLGILGASVNLAPLGVPAIPLTVPGMGIVNLAVQTAGETEQGKAEKELDLAAANFERDLALAGGNSDALAAASEIRDLNRETISHAIERNDVRAQFADAVGRQAALMREVAHLAIRRSENDSALLGRYFADPIFFLRSQNTLIEADYAFREAQRWVFFALRALEYKYNTPFTYDDGLRSWDTASLFGLRNFKELEGMLTAMTAFNTINNQNRANGRAAFTDSISLRQDVWKLGTNGAALAEFRSRLHGTFNSLRGVYELNLNPLVLTRELRLRDNQGNFFTGADYDLQGQVVSAGWYLDKIESLKFHFLDRSQPTPVTRQANFSYGGIAYDRTFCSRNLNAQGEAAGELTSFPFRFFVPGGTSSRDWTAYPTQEATVNLVFSAQPGEPASGANTSWRERGVATSRWTLEIPENRLNPDQVDDLVIYVHHSATPRQQCQ